MTTIRLLDHGPVTLREVHRLVPTYQPGSYVRAYDPDVGMTSLVCTAERNEALDLRSGEALRLLRSSPAGHPTRPDGRLNRPLLAFTVELA
jgi:hypothetical protein